MENKVCVRTEWDKINLNFGKVSELKSVEFRTDAQEDKKDSQI